MAPVTEFSGGNTQQSKLTSIAASNFVLSEADKNKELTNLFTWTASDFDLVIFAAVNYTLEASLSTTFTSPKVLYTGTERSVKMKVSDLNSFIRSMGVDVTTPVSFRVKAQILNSSLSPLISDTLTIPVTPYIVYSKMVLVGEATNNTEIEMTVASNNTHSWSKVVELKAGKVKFLGDGKYSFGGTFPSGKAEPNGAEMVVDKDGTYRVEFNDQTLDFKFTFGYETVGIIGSATTGDGSGWGQDINMNKNGNNWSLYRYLYSGEVKFRANDSWDVNWGDTAFPTGTGTFGGPNIPINNAGWYFIEFNDLTGVYKFTSVQVGIIGDATPGGWGTPTFMTSTGGRNWTIAINLTGKEMKFRLGNEWTVNWGGSGFPEGTATQDGPNIKIPADGFYVITFNDETGAYKFSSGYSTVGIIGDATEKGWGEDTDMTLKSGSSTEWYGTFYLTNKEVKFRAENGWDINWGASSFPTGTGTQGGPNIPIAEESYYYVEFNSATGAYSFTKLSVGIIGEATAGGWGTPTFMTNVGNYNWTITATLKKAEMKFRLGNDWTVNWGASTFPTGIGVQDGPNIPVSEEASYLIEFNSKTGEYKFTKQ
ncbi:MAG: SusF/SusE family outer membrane protein [Flammeovirgaceae bacterium]